MEPEGVFRRRKLPHWDVEGKPVFVTACLAGSLSTTGLSQIKEYREQLERGLRPSHENKNDWIQRIDKLVFQFVDDLLDHRSPARHLEDENQAKIVQDAFLHFSDERYALLAFVVMPSHHHWMFVPNDDWSRSVCGRPQMKQPIQKTPREIISHSVQSYTATMCNRIRGSSGPYWQRETYDHWVRDDDEMFRIVDYIENNPVKAGLVDRPENWRWSSARIRFKAKIQRGEPIHKSHAAKSNLSTPA